MSALHQRTIKGNTRLGQGVPVSLEPLYRASAERFAAVADAVKSSTEDLSWLCSGRSPLAAARDLLDLGPDLVVLTDGAEGAHGLMAATQVSVPAHAQ